MKNVLSSSFLYLLAFVWLGSSCCSAARSPIIIIPGQMGCQIEARLNEVSKTHFYCYSDRDWFRLWYNIDDALPFTQNCFLHYIEMKYDPVTHKYSNTDGVDTRIPGFGNTSAIEVLDPNLPRVTNYFKKFVDHFVKLGYSRGVDIRAAPYDWRLGPDQLREAGYYEQLQSLIETTFDQSGGQQVVIVVHSLGALVSHYFLTEIVGQEWKDMYIGQYITMAGVWAGTVTALHSVVSGERAGLFPFMSDKKINIVQRSFASEYWLFPRTVRGVWAKNQILVQTPYRNYSAFDIKSLMEDLDVQNISSMYNGVMSTVGQELVPPNVTVLCIYSKGMDTPESHVYGKRFPKGTYKKVLYGDGDGMVNLNSLRSCQNWIGAQSHPVEYLELNHVEHKSTAWNEDVIDIVQQAIESIVPGHPWQGCPLGHISPSLPFFMAARATSHCSSSSLGDLTMSRSNNCDVCPSSSASL